MMDEPHTHDIDIGTCGDFAHKFVDLLGCVADEYRLHITDDGLGATAVNPGNTAMIDFQIPPDAFKVYDVDDSTFGLATHRLEKKLRYARKGRGNKPGDHIHIWGDEYRLYTDIDRDGQGDRRGSTKGIDPDSIREEPDIPDLDLPWTADISDIGSFVDTMKAIKSEEYDYTQMTVDIDTDDGLADKETGDFCLYSQGDVTEDEFRFKNACEAEDGEGLVVSLFSKDWLVDFAKTIDTIGADKLTIEFGDSFPTSFNFEEPEYGITGTFMLAPRIMKDDSDESNSTVSEPSWGDVYGLAEKQKVKA